MKRVESVFRCVALNQRNMEPRLCVLRQAVVERDPGKYPECVACMDGQAVAKAHPSLVAEVVKALRVPGRDEKDDKSVPGRLFKERPCSKCKNSFRPTGTRHITCPGCKSSRKKTPDGTVPVASLATRKVARSEQSDVAGHKEPKDLPSYVLTVDFAEFPEIHRMLTQMAREELRTPENMLLYLLRDELRGRERALAEGR